MENGDLALNNIFLSADGKAIPPLVIVPDKNIMMSWFSEQITKAYRRGGGKRERRDSIIAVIYYI